jgi:hypothetical protein
LQRFTYWAQWLGKQFKMFINQPRNAEVFECPQLRSVWKSTCLSMSARGHTRARCAQKHSLNRRMFVGTKNKYTTKSCPRSRVTCARSDVTASGIYSTIGARTPRNGRTHARNEEKAFSVKNELVPAAVCHRITGNGLFWIHSCVGALYSLIMTHNGLVKHLRIMHGDEQVFPDAN